MYSACFTGHRKIRNSYYNFSNPTQEWINLSKCLRDVVVAFIDHGVNTFYSGMAIGVDQVAAEAVIDVRAFKPAINLIAAIPFPSQPSNWPGASKVNYNRILGMCQGQVVVNSDPYTPWKMLARDRYMVDNSHYVIAVWDGRTGGGTHHTVKFGYEAGRQIYVIHPETCAGHWLQEAP